MTLPADGLPLTASRSPRVQVVETTDSTNADVVVAASADPAAWPHLSLLVTDDQRQGRGRLDRTWTAPPGTALAVSVLVRVGGIPVRARGWVPLIAGAAMTGAIAAQLRGSSEYAVTLKWPNDVLLDAPAGSEQAGGKVCGILAEVLPGEPDAIVVGAGVNTRMTRAELPVATAASFLTAGVECDIDRLLADYVAAIDEQIDALRASGGHADGAGVRARVEALCATIGGDVIVSLPDGGRLSGRAQRVDGDGRLVVLADGVESAVSAGDVVHVR